MKTYITDNSNNLKINHYKDQIENVVKKVSHCKSAIDSLHTKMNLIDTQLKEQNKILVENITNNIVSFEKLQNDNKNLIESMQEQIDSLHSRLMSIEQDGVSIYLQVRITFIIIKKIIGNPQLLKIMTSMKQKRGLTIETT